MERIEALAGLAVSATPVVHPLLRYPTTVVNRINNWLGILSTNKSIANGGLRATVIAQKDTRRDTLLRKLARVRYLYCFASDEGESNPELDRIGFQRKRKPVVTGWRRMAFSRRPSQRRPSGSNTRWKPW